MKDKTKENEPLDDDKIDVSKSVFQVNREMHEQKLAELEEKQKELTHKKIDFAKMAGKVL